MITHAYHTGRGHPLPERSRARSVHTTGKIPRRRFACVDSDGGGGGGTRAHAKRTPENRFITRLPLCPSLSPGRAITRRIDNGVDNKYRCFRGKIKTFLRLQIDKRIDG